MEEPVNELVIYGAPSSLYTAKVRAFVRARRIPYVERLPSHPRYHEAIRPAVETHRIPVVEFADGSILQDSTLILDELERRYPGPVLGPRQALATHLLELISDRGLSKPAMHYRWNFRTVNDPFVVGEFGRAMRFPAPAEDIERRGQKVASKMSGYLSRIGVEPGTAPRIEESYQAGLALLDRHFSEHPFVLGGAPTRGDFALMGPLYGHLARDPYPLQLMQRIAPMVFRWTERINAGDLQAPEFPDRARETCADDLVPPTLAAWIAHVFEGFGDEVAKTAERLNGWVSEVPPAGPERWLSRDGEDQPVLGPIRVDYYGLQVEQQALAHQLWVLQRALDHLHGLQGAARRGCEALVAELGVERVMALGYPRLARVRNRLALAEA